MRAKSVILISAFLFLQACAGSHVPSEYQAPPEVAAFLVGSIAIARTGSLKDKNNSSKVVFRKVGEARRASLYISDNPYFPSDTDYREADRRGNVFSLALEPGDYEIVNVEFYYMNGYVEKSSSAREDFSVPFSLEAGKVHYLGEFLAFTTYGKNIFGLPILTGGYFEHGSKFERDLPLLSAKFPELEGRDVLQVDLKTNVPPFILSD